MEIFLEENIYNPNMADAVVIDGSLWFFNHVANALMRVSMESWKLLEFYPINKYSLSAKVLYHTIIHVKNVLILIPDIGNHAIAIVDLMTHEQKFISIDNEVFITAAFQYNGSIWLFSKVPTEKMKIFQLNLMTYELSECSFLVQQLKEILPNNVSRNDKNFRVVLFQKEFWILITNTEYLISLSPNTGEAKLHILGNGKAKFHRIATDGDSLVLIEDDSRSIVQWRPQKGVQKEIVIHQKEFVDTKYIDMYCVDGKVVLLPCFAEWIVVVDRNKETCSFFSVKSKDNIFPLPGRKEYPFYHRRCISYNNEVYVLPFSGKNLFVINTDTMKMYEKKIEISVEWIRHCYVGNIREHLELRGVAYEEDICLSAYVDYVIEQKKVYDIKANSRSKVGQSIWEKLR